VTTTLPLDGTDGVSVDVGDDPNFDAVSGTVVYADGGPDGSAVRINATGVLSQIRCLVTDTSILRISLWARKTGSNVSFVGSVRDGGTVVAQVRFVTSGELNIRNDTQTLDIYQDPLGTTPDETLVGACTAGSGTINSIILGFVNQITNGETEIGKAAWDVASMPSLSAPAGTIGYVGSLPVLRTYLGSTLVKGQAP
jgi:hypothetical protein